MLDLLLTGGQVLDGTGAPAKQADIGIKDGRIAAVGDLSGAAARRTLDISGSIAAPGFIDAHCHSDHWAAQVPETSAKLLQGVTTDVCGLCGNSPCPDRPESGYTTGDSTTFVDGSEAHTWGSYYEKMNAQGNSTNLLCFVGNANLRGSWAGTGPQTATAEQLGQMRGMLRQAMEEGAPGLSTGLTYVPSGYSSTEELVELCREIAPFGGIYDSHMRNEGVRVLGAIREVIEIAQRSGCQGHISHLKISDRSLHGHAADCLALLDEAEAAGCPIKFDVYPYTAGSTGLDSLLPPEFRPLSQKMLTPAQKETLTARLAQNDWDNLVLSCGWDKIFVGTAGRAAQYDGANLAALSGELGLPPQEALLRVLRESEGRATMIYHCIAEEDLVRFLKDPRCMIGTDAYARCYTGPTAEGKPHPRNYAGFVRYLSCYVLGQGILPLEEAIHRITELPARTFHLKDRGTLRPGSWADITVFDPAKLKENADYTDPVQQPDGIRFVLVNGVPAVEEGQFRDVRAGRALRGGRREKTADEV